MGKSTKDKQANTQKLNEEYSYQQNKRNNLDQTYGPQLAADASNSAASRGSLEDSLGGLSSYASSLPGSAPDVDTSQMAGDADTYRNFAQGNTESGKFYRGLMNTGGFTPEELTDIRTVGNRTTPSFFANLRNTMRTAQNATGGYSPGYSGQNAAMAREAAHQTQNAALDTETGIADRVHAAKLQGAGGLEREFLGGMGGASDLERAIAQTQLGNVGNDLQAQGMKAGALGNVAQGYGSLYGADQQASQFDQEMKLKAQGYSDNQIASILGAQRDLNPGMSGLDKAKMGASIAVPIIVAI